MTQATVTLRITGDGKGAISAVNSVKQKVGEFGSVADKATAAAERNAQATGKMGAAMGRLSNIIGGIGLAAAAVQAGRMADAMAGLDARLKITARTTQDYVAAQGLVLRIAQETRQDLQSTGQLYTRLTTALKDTGASQAEIARMTETINKAFAVSGASATEAAAAVTQLSQGLAAGALRGDEFNSVAEQAPRLMDALAKSLGVTRGDLRKMAEDGKITADVIRAALADAAGTIDAEFAQLPTTIGGGVTQIQNAIASMIRYIDSESSASSSIGQFFGNVAGFIENLPAVFIGMAGKVQEIWTTVVANFKAAGVLLKSAIMGPINEVLERLASAMATLASVAAELPASFGGQELAASIERARTAVSELTFTQDEYLTQMRDIGAARDAELARISQLTAAAQEEWTADRNRAASTKEYAAATRVANDAGKEREQVARRNAAAERALAAQRRPVLESYLAEARSRRELSAILREAEDQLTTELRMAGAVGDERARLGRAIEASNFAREVELANQRAGQPLTREEIEQVRQLYEAKLELIDATAASTRAQEESNRQVQDFAGTYLSQATDAIADFVTRGIRKWSDLWGAFKDIARRALADFIGNLLRQQIVVPIIARITGQGGVGSLGGLSGVSGGGGLGGLGGLLGGGFAAGSGVLGATIGATGSVLGGLGATTSFGLSSLAAGNIGVGLGALAGPIGIALTAVSVLRSLFSSNKPPDIRLGGSQARVRNQEGTISGSPFGDIRAGSRGISYQQFASPIAQFDTAIEGIVRAIGGGQVQLDAIRARLATWSVDLKGSAATVENVLGSRFEAILSTFSEEVQAFVRGATTIEERLERLNDVLTRPARAAQLLADVMRDDMLAAMTDAQREAFLINERFDAYKAQLEALGATVEQLTQLEDARNRALARAGADAVALGSQLVGLGGDLGTLAPELEPLPIHIEDTAEAIEDFGETMADFYARLGREAAEIQRQASELQRGVADELSRYLRGALFGELSSLTPAQQLTQARLQFDEAVSRSLGAGTLEERLAAAGSLGALRDQLRNLARGAYGSSDAYTAIDDATARQIGAVIQAFGGQVPAGLFPSAAGGSSTLVAGVTAVRDVLIDGQGAMLNELRSSNEINAAILAEIRAAGGLPSSPRKVRVG
jgi:tape measure domain-containing protein